jgi:hypothetical protein
MDRHRYLVGDLLTRVLAALLVSFTAMQTNASVKAEPQAATESPMNQGHP